MKNNNELELQGKPICKRCGTCCRRGGPALHYEDQVLLDREIIKPENLITIRRAESALNPINNQIEASAKEFVKIAGIAGSWQCSFYQEAPPACLIHHDRPLECRLLQCQDTGLLEKVIGHNYLNRSRIIPDSNPILETIIAHEELCSYNDANELVGHLEPRKDNSEVCDALNKIILKDLSIRNQAVSLYDLTIGLEMFYFGRPMFQTIRHPTIIINNIDGYIQFVQTNQNQ